MQFVARVGTADGRVLEESFTASDEIALRQDLEKRGYHVFEMRRRGLLAHLSLPSLGRGPRRIPSRDFLIFNQELAALLKAGLPLLQTLDIMLERMKDPHFRPVLADIRDRVKSGEDLSSSFAAYGEMFPRLYASSLKAGERSGELESVIRRFIRYMRLVLDARKKVISALVYPAVLIVLSLVIMTIMALVVVPKFTVFYNDLEGELPFITQVVVNVSQFLRSYFVWVLTGVVLAVAGTISWSRTEQGRLSLDHWRLRLPLLGGIVQRFALSEFARSLATLLTGGIPLVSAMETAVSAVGNARIRSQLEPTIQEVREGRPFHAALDEAGVMPEMAVDMVKVGEATGALDEMLSNVADFFDEQVETQTARFLSLLEPVMLVIMGTLIATILISLYLPMFSVLSRTNF